MKNLRFGDRAKDDISGFTGIVVAETNWLYGCTRVGLQAEKLDKDGKIQDTQWFDEDQLRRVKATVIKPTDPEAVITGGPNRREEVR